MAATLSLANLWKQTKNLNFYEEGLIWLDLLWGLHPENQTVIKFWVLAGMFVVFSGLIGASTFLDWKGVESLGNEMFLPACQIALTVISYRFNQKELNRMMDKITTFWASELFDQQLRDEIDSIDFKIKAFIVLYRSMISMAVIIYFVRPFVSVNRELLFDWYELCDRKENACYSVMMFIQGFNYFILTISIFIFDGLYILFIAKGYGQLKMIKYRIQMVEFDEDDDVVMGEINLIGRHHSFILSYLSDVNKFYSSIILGQFISCTSSLCIGSFLLTKDGLASLESMIKFVFYVICISGELILYCFWGQIISDEAISVCDAVYSTRWWVKTQPKLRKSLSLIILRAQSPTGLSIGGISMVNLSVYLYLYKTAFSFYTLMNQLYNK